MQNVNTGSPLERIAIDIVGPLPRTENGNEYIMVVTDYQMDRGIRSARSHSANNG